MVSTQSGPAWVVAVMVALSAACPASADAKEEGLALHYDFGEGAGDVLRDKSGNGHDAGIHGAQWAKGKHGGALRYDGVDDYADCGSASGLKFKGSFSLAVWVKHDSVSGWQDYVGDYVGGTSGYVIAQNDGMLYFHNAGATPHIIAMEEELVYPGIWHHVVAVYNREGGAMLVYVDGMERASQQVTGTPKSDPATPLRLGAYGGGAASVSRACSAR